LPGQPGDRIPDAVWGFPRCHRIPVRNHRSGSLTWCTVPYGGSLPKLDHVGYIDFLGIPNMNRTQELNLIVGLGVEHGPSEWGG
jgi:hypothetical protein